MISLELMHLHILVPHYVPYYITAHQRQQLGILKRNNIITGTLHYLRTIHFDLAFNITNSITLELFLLCLTDEMKLLQLLFHN